MNKLNRILFTGLLTLALAACGSENKDQAETAESEEAMEMTEEVYSGPNAELIAEFNASGDVLLAALDGLTPEQWTFRESDDRWSIAEVTEHIVLTEPALVNGFVGGMVSGEPNAEDTGGYAEMDEGVRAMVRDRSNPIQTGPDFEPTGAYATPEEGIEAFMAVRANTLEFLENTDVDFRQYTGTVNPEIEPMDAYQWLLFAAGHVERHTAQIEQVKADPDYPAM